MLAKRAVLVNFNVWTRVVVDIPEHADVNDDMYFDTIANAAIKQFRENIKEDKHYPYPDNIVDIEDDIEIPYGEAPEDIEENN